MSRNATSLFAHTNQDIDGANFAETYARISRDSTVIQRANWNWLFSKIAELGLEENLQFRIVRVVNPLYGYDDVLEINPKFSNALKLASLILSESHQILKSDEALLGETIDEVFRNHPFCADLYRAELEEFKADDFSASRQELVESLRDRLGEESPIAERIEDMVTYSDSDSDEYKSVESLARAHWCNDRKTHLIEELAEELDYIIKADAIGEQRIGDGLVMQGATIKLTKRQENFARLFRG